RGSTACSVLVVAQQLAQQEERADGAGHHGDGRHRVAAGVAAHTAVLVARLVGQVLGHVRDLPAVAGAATSQTHGHAAATFDQASGRVGGAGGVLAHAVAHAFAGAVEALLEIAGSVHWSLLCVEAPA